MYHLFIKMIGKEIICPETGCISQTKNCKTISYGIKLSGQMMNVLWIKEHNLMKHLLHS